MNVYVIKMTGTVEDDPSATIPNLLTKTTIINLTVSNGCIEDIISPTTYGVADEILYLIGTDSTIQIDFAWTQEVPGCPIEFSEVMIDSLTQAERDLNPDE